MSLTQQNRHDILQLLERGKRVSDIAFDYSIAKGTVYNIVWAANKAKKLDLHGKCDHTTRKCQCVNNTNRTYQDYLRGAGYRIKEDEDIEEA